MKRTKREINIIVINFLLYFILFVIWTSLFLFSVFPQYNNITRAKKETQSIYDEIQKVKKEGVSFGDFKKISWVLEKTTYSQEILKALDPEFYTSVFANNTEQNYVDFLDQKEREINSPENVAQREEKKKEISSILPSYSDIYLGEDIGNLSDFSFVNYIERLLETFGISFKEWIGIKSIVLVDEFASKSSESLENNIFYIPLKLTLNGTKEGILKFLYFAENVGSIRLWEEDKIEVFSDFTLSNEAKKFFWRSSLGNRNMYQNQIFDIESIKFDEYIDESYTQRGNKESLKDFIIATQWSRPYNIEIELRFYVKSVENYILKEEVNKFRDSYNLSTIVYWKLLKSKSVSASTRFNAQKTLKYLNEIKKDVNGLTKKLRQGNLNEVYKIAMEYNDIIDTLNSKNGYQYYIVEYLSILWDSLRKAEAVLQNENTSEQEKEKAQSIKSYIESIESTYSSLYRKTNEPNKDYYQRIGTKDVYLIVKDLYYQLNAKK